MNKQILSNILMRGVSLFLLLLSLSGMAQNTIDVGKGKLYGVNGHDYVVVANIIAANENSMTNDVLADRLTMTDGKEFYSFKTSHGYIHEFYVNRTKYPLSTEMLIVEGISMETGFVSGFVYAFVEDGSNLYVVDVVNDKIINTLIDNLQKGEDFKIVYMEYSRNIMIINNGIAYVYKDWKKKTSSVRSPIYDEGEGESSTFSFDGKQVKSPHNGVFIKSGKKMVIK